MNPLSLFRLLRPLAAAALLSLALAVPGHAEDATPLVSTGWLKQHLKDPNVLVLDIRSAIDGGGVEAYQKGHIPGAVHSDYDKAGWRVTRGGVPFMLPTVAELEKLIGETGIDEDTHVVVVPAGVHYTDFGSAARTYWTLKVAGVPNVSILDGGYAAWAAENNQIETGAEQAVAENLHRDIEQVAVRRCARGRGDRARRRRDPGRCTARVVLRRQGEGAGVARLRAHSGRREPRQRDVLRREDQSPEAAGRACLACRDRGAGRADGRVLQHRSLGRDRLVRAVGSSRPQGREALLRLDGGLDLGRQPPACLRPHQVG